MAVPRLPFTGSAGALADNPGLASRPPPTVTS